MPIYNECNSLQGWLGNTTTIFSVDTADFPAGTSSSIHAVEPTNTQYFLYATLFSTIPQNWSGYPILTAWVKVPNANTLNVNVITEPNGWTEHIYPVTVQANVWTQISVDLRNASQEGRIPNLSQLLGVRFDYAIANNPSEIRVGRIELNITGGGGTDFVLTLLQATGGVISSPSTVYPANSYATVTAYPDVGNSLDNWVVDGVATTNKANPLSQLMDANHSVQAVFVAGGQPIPLLPIILGGAGVIVLYLLLK